MKWLSGEVVDLLDVIRRSTFRHVWWFELEIGEVTFNDIRIVKQVCLIKLKTCQTIISCVSDRPIVLDSLMKEGIHRENPLDVTEWIVSPDNVITVITEIINELYEYDNRVSGDTVRIELNHNTLFSLMTYKNTNK